MSRECACVYYDNGKCQKFSDDKFNSWCVEGPCTDRVPSNGDRIRDMSDEELECFLGQHSICSRIEWCPDHGECHRCVLEWLKEPAKEERR